MGRGYIEKTKQSQNESFRIEESDSQNVSRSQSFEHSVEQSFDLSMSQDMVQSRDQSMRDNIIRTGSRQSIIVDRLNNAMPDVLADKQIIKAPKQLNRIDAPDVVDSIYSVPTNFMVVREQDDVYMKEVKRNFRLFKEMDVMKQGVTTVEGRDILNDLISACRWYNATHWKFWGKEGESLREVKRIRDLAIKARDKMDKEIKGDSTNRRRRERKAYRRFVKEDDKGRYNLIKMDVDERDRYYARGINENFATRNSTIWAAFKAYTFGFFGRNILNIAMGAVAGASWLVTWPIARAYAAASGKERYKKGFNIKIPRPMSPAGWYQHYAFGQRHVTAAMKRSLMDDNGQLYTAALTVAKIVQFNIWDPFKHIVTLDIAKLSGGGYVMPHEKEVKDDRYKRSKEDLEQANSHYDANDEEVMEEKETEQSLAEAKKVLAERQLDPDNHEDEKTLRRSAILILQEMAGKHEDYIKDLPTELIVELAEDIMNSTEAKEDLRMRVDERIDEYNK